MANRIFVPDGSDDQISSFVYPAESKSKTAFATQDFSKHASAPTRENSERSCLCSATLFLASVRENPELFRTGATWQGDIKWSAKSGPARIDAHERAYKGKGQKLESASYRAFLLRPSAKIFGGIRA
mmetsp:Transcript_4720/g.10143  ORF Transcript_4720/g.10143 Transcript_4720/m.10143 type:complete len:127 (-) Transcript_4720:96-476(-)